MERLLRHYVPRNDKRGRARNDTTDRGDKGG